MTTTTLGELFPELETCRPKPQKKPRPAGKDTAQKLKALYPELESWWPVLVTRAWLNWLEASGLPVTEPEIRDERFTEFLISQLEERMKEAGQWR